MNKQIFRFLLVIQAVFLIGCNTSQPKTVDILIIGGGASGTAAGIHASRLGAKTLIAEEIMWLGGMLTSAGVSAIDGNYRLPAGMYGEFKDSLVSHYEHLDSLNTGWVSSVLFEPSVGNKIFQTMTSNEKNLEVWHKTTFISAKREDGVWNVKLDVDGRIKTVKATILIDATELGDVAKYCGVTYDIGMESRYVTMEYIAPTKANNIVQNLTYVAILKDYGKDVRIPKPEGYDPSYFACAAINDLCFNPLQPHRMWSKEMMITYGKLPNNKYMINWPIEGNDFYTNIVNMTPAERTEVLKEAKNFTMNFLYFIQNELGFYTLGLADDEFPTNDLLPFIPYHRESRRIHGKTRFTLNYISDPFDQEFPLYRTNIAVGDYPVDHHHGRNPDPENWLKLYFYPIPSYGLPLGALIPQNVNGLIVAEKSISVSNLVNGTTRLQPVVLQIGQTAGTLAALAIRNNSRVEDVSVRDVQKEILAAGGYLMPYLDVEKDNPLFPIYQRIGVTGILRGEGRSIGWSNETWLRADEPLLKSELDGLSEIYKNVSLAHLKDTVTLEDAITLINNIKQNTDIYEQAQALYKKYNLGEFALNNSIKRGNFAVLVDALLNPFDKEVDIYGQLAP